MVVGLIGLLGAMSAIAINSARSKMRDAKRISDVRQFQSALEDYFKEVNHYPLQTDLRLGDPTASRCLTSTGFASNCSNAPQVFMQVVPSEFMKGVDGLTRCGVPVQAGYCYNVVGEGGSYRLGFELEHGIKEAGISAGQNCLLPEIGVKSGVCVE
jgi:hypothetical protein